MSCCPYRGEKKEDMTHPEINFRGCVFLEPYGDADTCIERKYGVHADNADFFLLYQRTSAFVCVQIKFRVNDVFFLFSYLTLVSAGQYSTL